MALLCAKIWFFCIRPHFADLDLYLFSSNKWIYLTDAHRKCSGHCAKQTTVALSFDQTVKYASKLTYDEMVFQLLLLLMRTVGSAYVCTMNCDFKLHPLISHCFDKKFPKKNQGVVWKISNELCFQKKYKFCKFMVTDGDQHTNSSRLDSTPTTAAAEVAKTRYFWAQRSILKRSYTQKTIFFSFSSLPSSLFNLTVYVPELVAANHSQSNGRAYGFIFKTD